MTVHTRFVAALARAGCTKPPEEIVALVPEASARRYYRLSFADRSTLVGVIDESRGGLELFAAVQAFLQKNGVAVPQIIFSDAAAGVMLVEDLGDESLNSVLENSGARMRHYENAILHMLSWQRLADDGSCPAFRLEFDRTKLMQEFEFFIEHALLGYYKKKIGAEDLNRLRAGFFEISRKLAAPRKVFTHRDYHSRNIMAAGGRQYVIDFQDARLGLFQYDLCSLLCDAYAPLAQEERAQLTDFAFEAGRGIHRQSREEFAYFFRLSAFQRVVKAMGTFARQATLGRRDFEAYLDPALGILDEIAAGEPQLNRVSRLLYPDTQISK